jgi:hypothetical protein
MKEMEGDKFTQGQENMLRDVMRNSIPDVQGLTVEMITNAFGGFAEIMSDNESPEMMALVSAL